MNQIPHSATDALARCVLVTVLLVSSPQTARSQQDPSSTQPAELFRNFLANPPFIKRIEFKRSLNHFRIADAKGSDYVLDGFTAYEGSLQPKGFYLKHISNSIVYYKPAADHSGVFRSPLPGRELVFGESERFFWTLADGHTRLATLPKRSEDGASPDNKGATYSLQLRTLRAVVRLGLEELVDETIVWHTAGAFAGISKDGLSFEGRITAHTNGAPSELHYSVGQQSYKIQYTYQPDNFFPPWQIRRETIVPTPGEGVIYTNIIDRLEIGIEPGAVDGFRPSDFRTRNEAYDSFITSSNGLRYTVSSRNDWAPVDETPPPVRLSKLRGSVPKFLGMVALLIPVFVVVVILVTQRRRKSTSRG